MSRVQGHIGAANTEKLRAFVFQKESGGSGGYSNTGNQFGFIGGYQFGAAALEDVGYLKPGTSKIGNRALDTPGNWTIAGGKAAYLASPALQDQAFTKLIERNYRTLTSLGLIGPNSSSGDVAGYLAAAHLLGPGGVKNKGLNGTDANGTAGKVYFQGAKSATGDKSGLPPPSAAGSAPQSGSSQSGSSTGSSSSGSSDPPPPALPPNRVANTVTIGSSGAQYESLPVPFPNPLGTFSTFNCVMTVSSISAASHRDPLTTYKAGKIGTVVARSAGTGDLGPQTAMTSVRNPSGKYEFFIDNLDIQTLMTYNQQTKGSNAYDITFDVFEPYSMGIFLQTCQIAAYENGWRRGYLESTFLLTIEFVGYDESGTPFPLDRVARHIPFTIKDISMTNKASGSVYKVKGHPTNETILEDQYAKLQSDISISGKTVKEILQSGPQSLQFVLNERIRKLKRTQDTNKFDEFVIIFPEINENVLDVIKKDDNSSATQNPTVTTKPITISRPSNATELIQDESTLNAIGRSVLELNQNMPGEGAINRQSDVQPDPKKPVDRSLVNNKSDTRQFTYMQGSSIINAITSVLLKSKYCIDNVNDPTKRDENGMIDWFRVETQIDYQPPQSGSASNPQPKLIIYKVVPYKVHASYFSSLNMTKEKYDKLKGEAAKTYDYMYTGNNTEILNLEIEFPRAFFNTIVTADYGQFNDQSQLADQMGAGQQGANYDYGPYANINGLDLPPVEINGLDLPPPGNMTGDVLPGYATQNKPTSGGAGADDYRSNVAKGFQNALYNSSTDLVTVTMTIQGDPYYLADSGAGNFSNSGSGRFNVTADQAMDYQSGEVDIIVNFRSPLDYDTETGIMDFGNSEVVKEFSGLYRVNFVAHRISRGKFTQELKLLRRPVPPENLIGSTQADGDAGEAEALAFLEEQRQRLEDEAFERDWVIAINGGIAPWELS
jgi:hypothetical protein